MKQHYIYSFILAINSKTLLRIESVFDGRRCGLLSCFGCCAPLENGLQVLISLELWCSKTAVSGTAVQGRIYAPYVGTGGRMAAGVVLLAEAWAIGEFALLLLLQVGDDFEVNDIYSFLYYCLKVLLILYNHLIVLII